MDEQISNVGEIVKIAAAMDKQGNEQKYLHSAAFAAAMVTAEAGVTPDEIAVVLILTYFFHINTCKRTLPEHKQVVTAFKEALKNTRLIVPSEEQFALVLTADGELEAEAQECRYTRASRM